MPLAVLRAAFSALVIALNFRYVPRALVMRLILLRLRRSLMRGPYLCRDGRARVTWRRPGRMPWWKPVHSSVATRRARAGLLLGVVLVLLAVAGANLRGDAPGPGVPLVPTPPGGHGGGEPFADPFAYDADREADLMRRAAAGTSHVLYVRSPGGALATARRVARWRPQVEAAARRAGVPADLLEGLVYLESAGRPDAMAGSTEGAVGLTQIL